MSLSNDLWLNCSISSIDGTSVSRHNYSLDVAMGAPRVSPIGVQRSGVKVHAYNSLENQFQRNALPPIPTFGLFDDFYAQAMSLDYLQQQRQEAAKMPSNPECPSNACTWNSRWISVDGFPPHMGEKILHYFFTLGPVCDKCDSDDGKCFYLCYANNLDCIRAQMQAASLPRSLKVNVKHWKDDPPIVQGKDRPCNLTGVFPQKAVYQHWGRDIMDLKKRYNSYIYD